MDEVAVVGRDDERGAIEAFLTVVDRGPAALVLAGEAGIGKTILWEVGVNAAVRRFGWVLICRGVEAEASLSFAGLSELLAPVLADTMPSLSAPRRRALEVALLLAEPGSEVPNAHAIGLAVFDVLNVLAAQGPVVVAVDDLQWMDVASAGVLHVALRRLRDAPVGLLATVRQSPDVAVPIDLERGFTEAWLQRRCLLVHSVWVRLTICCVPRLGLELTRPELLRVHEATAGNPLFVLELGRELVRLGRDFSLVSRCLCRAVSDSSSEFAWLDSRWMRVTCSSLLRWRAGRPWRWWRRRTDTGDVPSRRSMRPSGLGWFG